LLEKTVLRNKLSALSNRSDAAFAEADTLAGSSTEEVQFGSTDNRSTFDFDFVDFGRVNGELAFDTFSGHDPSDDEHFPRTGSAASDDRATEDLNPLFVPFLNLGVHVDGVADTELIHTGLEVGAFNGLQNLLTHDSTAEQEMGWPLQGLLGW
jgi:hypothetical protein